MNLNYLGSAPTHTHTHTHQAHQASSAASTSAVSDNSHSDELGQTDSYYSHPDQDESDLQAGQLKALRGWASFGGSNANAPAQGNSWAQPTSLNGNGAAGFSSAPASGQAPLEQMLESLLSQLQQMWEGSPAASGGSAQVQAAAPSHNSNAGNSSNVPATATPAQAAAPSSTATQATSTPSGSTTPTDGSAQPALLWDTRANNGKGGYVSKQQSDAMSGLSPDQVAAQDAAAARANNINSYSQNQQNLVAIGWDFNSNNASQTGMVGDPTIDLIEQMGGNPTSPTPMAYRSLVNASGNANPLRMAANALHRGESLESVLASVNQAYQPSGDGLTMEQVQSLQSTMEKYNLVPTA